jgi:Leucine-rich repeat (LRR) protein
MGRLTSLRFLDLRANQLTGLPSGLAKLENLEKLDLRWNKKLSIPKWITKLAARGCLVYI